MNRELVFHTGEIFFARDLYAAITPSSTEKSVTRRVSADDR